MKWQVHFALYFTQYILENKQAKEKKNSKSTEKSLKNLLYSLDNCYLRNSYY